MDWILWRTVGATRRVARLAGAGAQTELDMVCRVLRGLTHLPDPVGARALYVLMQCDRTRRAKAAVEDFERRLTHMSRGDVCIDAGADFGVMTRRMAATGATVHAFEPDPLAFERLKTATAGLPNVVLHNAALSCEAGTVTLHRSAATDDDPVLTEGSSLVVRHRADGGETVEVEAVDMAEFIASLQPARPILVKMDVEGEEISLLKHLIARDALPAIGTIYEETHERHYPEHKDEIVRLLGQTRRLRGTVVNFDWP